MQMSMESGMHSLMHPIFVYIVVHWKILGIKEKT